MELLYIFVGAIVTGIVGYLVYKYQIKGDVIIDQYRVQLKYLKKDDYKLVTSIGGTIMFFNSSGEPKVVKIAGVRFYDGTDFINLEIQDLGLLPTVTIEPKRQQEFSFTYGFEKPFHFPLLAIWDKVTHLELEYFVGEKKKKLFIEGYDLVEDWFIR